MKKCIAIFLLVTLAGAFGYWTYSYWSDNRGNHIATSDLPVQTRNEMANRFQTYISTAACAKCHAKNASLWSESGHARTFHRTSEFELARRLYGHEFKDQQRGVTFRYHYDDRDGLSVTIPELFGEDRFPLPFALGSGKHGVTFLSLVPHERGHTIGVEHRVTQYSHPNITLNFTPGHRDLTAPAEDIENFGRILSPDELNKCIGCHTTRFDLKDHQIVNLDAHVGCESCHGPGSRHQEFSLKKIDDPEMQVAHRWPTAESELRTCGKCHRLPEMLSQTELSRTSVGLVRYQPVGLMQSACYLRSEGELRCTTCHNPHEAVSTDRKYYEQICKNCHSHPDSEVCKVNPRSNCIECHMPPVSLGLAYFYDHWIRVRDADDPPAVELENHEPKAD